MIGKTVSHYKITRELGSGGMGVVYEAVDTKLDRTVALKFLPPESTRDPDAKARFVHEAKAASALDHPNVCNIHEIDETDDGQLFIVMACYEGETLKERISRGSLPLDEAVGITRQIAQGLAKAHEREIVHRDIKPANIFITHDGLVKILDFGLVKLSSQTMLTKTGTTIGTVSYMSPEQAKRENSDERTDLWCLGVVLFEMVTGRLPFPGDHEQAVIYAILNQDPAPLSRYADSRTIALQPVVDRLLAKNPDERFPTTAAFIVALEAIRKDLGLAINPDANWHSPLPVGKGLSRHRMFIVFGVFLAVLLSVFVFRFLRPSGFPMATSPPSPFVIAIASFWGPDPEALKEGRLLQVLVTREITGMLGEEENVRIVATEEAMTPRTPDQAQTLGREVGATLVIWGNVITVGEEMEIFPNLTVARFGGGGWSPGQQDSSLTIDLAEPSQIELRKIKAGEIGRLALLSGARFYRKQDPGQALDILGQMVPPMAESERLRGAILGDLDRWNDAKTAYQAAVMLAPGDFWPRIGLGWVLSRQKLYQEALLVFEEAASLDSTSAVPPYFIGSTLDDLDRYDEALASFERSIDLDPTYVRAHLGIGWVNFWQGENAAAVEQFQRASRIDPEDAAPYLALGWLFGNPLGRLEDAMSAYQEALSLEPENTQALAGMAKLMPPGGQEAERLYRRCIELEPAEIDHLIDLAQHYVVRTEWDEAEAQFRLALEMRPWSTWAHLAFGHMEEARKDTAAAITLYQRAAELDTLDFSSRIRLGWLYQSQGKTDQADRLFAEAGALEEGDNYSFTQFIIANNFLADNQLDQAIATYELALSHDPVEEYVYFFAGLAYEQAGRLEDAIASFERALELDSRDLEPVLHRYLVLCRLGRGQEASMSLTEFSDAFEKQDAPIDYGCLVDVLDFFRGVKTEAQCLAAIEAAIEARGRDVGTEGLYLLGKTFLVGGVCAGATVGPDLEKAQQYFEQGVEWGGDSDEFWSSLARLELGKLE